MVIVEINDKQECFRDIDELLYYLRTECNVDLRNVFLSNMDEVDKSISSAINDLDCLGIDDECEYLEQLKEEIETLRLNKEKKNELLNLIEKVDDGLEEHVVQYANFALESLEKIKLK